MSERRMSWDINCSEKSGDFGIDGRGDLKVRRERVVTREGVTLRLAIFNVR